MQVWRVLGAVVLGSGGLLAVLVAMAQARDSAIGIRAGRQPKTGGRVAAAAGTGLAVLAVALLLTLTVLPQSVVWALAVAVWLILLALFLVG
jgi:hypothetical protein